METEELRHILRVFGGLRRTADLIGCSSGALHSYCRGRTRVAPIVAVLLREAAERRTASDREIALALRTRVAMLLERAERQRNSDGRPPRRNQREMAACVDQIVAVVAASAKPVSPAEIRRQLGASQRGLSQPLRCAVAGGRIQREGRASHVRYCASGSEVPVAAGPSVWDWGPLARERQRASPVVRAEAERVIALLRERGPLRVCQIRAALEIPSVQARGTLLYAERIGLVTRVAGGGPLVYAASPEGDA
jgi:hypothetical protein